MDADRTPTHQPRAGVLSRRRALAGGAAGAAAIWAAPAIVTSEAAAAASGGQAPGGIAGTLTVCQHEPDPGDLFQVTADRQGGGGSGSTTTDALGNYSIPGLPPGTYDITTHPLFGFPDQFDSGVVVSSGVTTPFSYDYSAGGC